MSPFWEEKKGNTCDTVSPVKLQHHLKFKSLNPSLNPQLHHPTSFSFPFELVHSASQLVHNKDMDTSACIINELTQGMELAMHLNSILSSESSSETKQALIQQIISSYDRALLMVNSGDSVGQTPPMLSQPDSFVSLDGSPRSQDVTQPFDDQQEEKVLSKKRETMPTWRNQIRISTVNGLEGNTDDGYNWRKYGQKDILGSKFPRSYYRCTYRYVQHCMARKQVQRTNEDPTVFEITYKGKHTCNPTTAPSVSTQKSSEKHEQIKQNNHQLPLPPKSTSDLDAMIPCSFSFPSASFENYQQSHFLYETDYGVSPSISSPGTSGSDYFRHHDDSNLSRITAASATNSPLAFPADPQDLSQDFAFNNSGYFI